MRGDRSVLSTSCATAVAVTPYDSSRKPTSRCALFQETPILFICLNPTQTRGSQRGAAILRDLACESRVLDYWRKMRPDTAEVRAEFLARGGLDSAAVQVGKVAVVAPGRVRTTTLN